MDEKIYIYAIIRKPKTVKKIFGTVTSFKGRGLNERKLYLVLFRDLAAVVSDTHLTHFDQLDKNKLANSIEDHDQVITNLMRKYDVLPMRFGMIVESSEEIINLFKKVYLQFKVALERVTEKVEFIVEVFWNEKKVIKYIIQENTKIQQLQKEVETRGIILGLASKIKLGKYIFDAIDINRRKYNEDILDQLTLQFPVFSSGKLHDTSENDNSLSTNKEMIMNYSFLVEKGQEAVLESRLNQIAEKYEDELGFKLIGPMAPYSFADINLKQGNFELVDNARKILGLGASATFPEIKRAYNKLATRFHPDKHEYKKDPILLGETTKKLKDVVTANEILTTYCKYYISELAEGQGLSTDKGEIYSFKKEDVENSIFFEESQLGMK